MKKGYVLVSACLLGKNCKYNGGNNYNEQVIKYLKDYEIIPICPEVMAGFSTPRAPLEIYNDRLINNRGEDYTKDMQRACADIVKIINEKKTILAVLKARSPSCGKGEIYDGTFSHTIVCRNGLACEVVLKEGIKVLTEEEIGGKK